MFLILSSFTTISSDFKLIPINHDGIQRSNGQHCVKDMERRIKKGLKHKKKKRKILRKSKMRRSLHSLLLLRPVNVSKAGKPLFNKKAWKRANSVLREILRGEASDRPGFEFYSRWPDAKGEPKTDKNAIQLLDCNRGTNDVENEQKQCLTTFDTWHVLVWKLAAPCWLSGSTGTSNECLKITQLSFQRLATMTLGRLTCFNL
jgi:hypothetical protein